MRNHWILSTICGLVLCLWFSSEARPQTSFGSVDGTATDASGALIAGAHVTLRNVQTDERRASVTNERGQFVFPSVVPGSYELSVESSGFKKTVRGNVQVDVQQTVRADVVLELGSVTESVEVKGEIPLLQPSTSSLGQVIDNRRVVDLPLNGRDVFGLVALTPGVTPLGSLGGAPSTINSYAYTNFSASGSLGLTSTTIVDGGVVDGNRTTSGMFVPSVDAVAEFKVLTNSFSAEFGRTSGGIVNVVMKSGTNALHGGLYEFVRNRVFDANNYFSNRAGQKIPGYTYNTFGGIVGGPVVVPRVYNGKDRTFFFVAYEGFRNHLAVTPLLTVPTALQRQGDFSQTFNAAGQLISVFDPLTTRQNPDGTYTRTAFPGNIVPANRIDPVAAKVLPYWGKPNLPGNQFTGANNFIGNGPAVNIYDQVTARFDENLNSANRMFGRYSHNDYIRGSGNIFNNLWGDWNVASTTQGGQPSLIWVDQAVLHHTITPSPTLLIDLSASMMRYLLKKTPLSSGQPLTTLGFPQALSDAVPQKNFPSLYITNVVSLNGGAGDLYDESDGSQIYAGSVNKIKGIHSIKIGADYRILSLNDFETGAITAPGIYNFTTAWTQANPFTASASSGIALASFELGDVASASQTIQSRPALTNKYYGLFFQDDIRLNSKLTLNLGIRYEVETPRTDRYNQITWFDPNAASPLAGQSGLSGLKGGLEFAGVNGNPRTQENTDYNKFAPRVGIAYSLNSKTVIRTGYGVFFGPFNSVAANLSNLGFSSTTTMTTTTDGGLTPADVLSNPYPKGLNTATGSSQGLATLAGQNLATAYFRNSRVPYSQQWNFDIQRQLPGNTLLEVAYAGSHNVKLQQFWQFNSLNPSYYSLGSQLQQSVPNPFLGMISTGPLSAATVPRSQFLLPFPQFGTISGVAYAGDSVYHSFQLKLERRFSNGLMLLAAYTNSKSIGNVDALGTLGGDVLTGLQDYYNRRLERSIVPTDISQRLVINYNYELPVGRGKHFGAAWPRALDLVAGGWQFNGISTFQSGMPFYINLNSAAAFGGTRPNNNGTTAYLGSSPRNVYHAFNTSVFSQPPAFSLGSVSRTLPDVRGMGTNNSDLSLFKIVTIRERFRLQFRAEAFNAFNRTQFTITAAGVATTAYGNPLFGQFTTAAPARTVQLALKLNF